MISNHPPRRAMEFPAVTWANRPSAATSGQIIRVTDLGNALFIRNGADWASVGGDCVIVQSAVAGISVTGTVNETVFATVDIPAGLLGLSGEIVTEVWFSTTNNSNAKTMRVRLGGISGPAVFRSAGNQAAHLGMAVFANRGATNSQAYFPALVQPYSDNATGIATSSVDTSVAQTLLITGQLTVGTDTLTLVRYRVTLRRP